MMPDGHVYYSFPDEGLLDGLTMSTAQLSYTFLTRASRISGVASQSHRGKITCPPRG